MRKTYKLCISVSALFLLSVVSGYSWPIGIEKQSLESFLFLAPSGIIAHLSNPTSPYYPVYEQVSGRYREGFFDKAELLIVEMILLILVFHTLANWKKKT